MLCMYGKGFQERLGVGVLYMYTHKNYLCMEIGVFGVLSHMPKGRVTQSDKIPKD